MPVRSTKEIDTPSVGMTLWRYMSFAKYVSLLTTRTLYFANTIAFEDKHDGVMSDLSLDHKQREVKRLLDKAQGTLSTGVDVDSMARELRQLLRASALAMRKKSFVNCWHMNRTQSAAMWGLYTSNSQEGVAIRSTVGRLTKALAGCDKDIYIGSVLYLDTEKRPISADSAFNMVLTKRKSFEHENEVRAIFYDKAGTFAATDERGIGITVDVSQLIVEVWVSPYSNEWLRRLVEQVSKDYGVKCPVKKSALYDDPALS
jgi:hypothetical protein